MIDHNEYIANFIIENKLIVNKKDRDVICYVYFELVGCDPDEYQIEYIQSLIKNS